MLLQSSESIRVSTVLAPDWRLINSADSSGHGASGVGQKMKQEPSGAFLSAVFVDYDNIYLSLKRKSEEAAKRFAKDSALWLKGIETSLLITPTNSPTTAGVRRIVMNRCYGNPVPRRNATDNSTDMNSFPFVRHHFLRSGFEIVDCPPLTAQLKNSSDIRMVMDVRDYLTHATYFDEFIILSGDADFTPVLHRLRAHARRTVIFANDYTAAPYTAISDGEVRESNLITLLLEGRVGDQAMSGTPLEVQDESVRRKIIAEVVAAVQTASAPVPLEVLADRAVRTIGHDRTIGTGWAGAGGFRELLSQSLPEGLRLTEQAPYLVIDTKRHLIAQTAVLPDPRDTRIERAVSGTAPSIGAHGHVGRADGTSQSSYSFPSGGPPNTQPAGYAQPAASPFLGSQPIGTGQAYSDPADNRQPAKIIAQAPPVSRTNEASTSVQQAIGRIHEACQAPTLSPPEYRILFEAMAQEIGENNLSGVQTILNIVQRARERGLDVRRDDVRFVLEVVSETDPWFEQGASANLFAGRFRNFVVARCRSQGLNLSADELDLIEAWFAGNTPLPVISGQPLRTSQQPLPNPAAMARPPQVSGPDPRGSERHRLLEDMPQQIEPRPMARAPMSAQQQGGLGLGTSELAPQAEFGSDEFPRIVRTRLRG